MKELNQINIEKIITMLPHRYPMLLVDRVIEITENGLVALKNVTINENFFNGHFPAHPVMPGVLIIEAMAQAAAILVVSDESINSEGKLVYLTSIEEAAFRKPVVPGDSLHLHISKLKHRGKLWKMQGEAKVEGVRVANVVFSAIVIDR